MAEKEIAGKIGGKLFEPSDPLFGREILGNIAVVAIPDLSVIHRSRTDGNLPENPRLDSGHSPDHAARAAAFAGKEYRIARRNDIAVCDDRDSRPGDNTGKERPLRRPRQFIFCKSRMDGYGIYPRFTDDPEAVGKPLLPVRTRRPRRHLTVSIPRHRERAAASTDRRRSRSSKSSVPPPRFLISGAAQPRLMSMPYGLIVASLSMTGPTFSLSTSASW